MHKSPTSAWVHTLFEKAEFIQAHAAALSLFAANPNDYENGLLFLRCAIFIERVDSVIAVLNDCAAQLTPQNLHLLMFQAQLCSGDYKAAWQHLHLAGLAEGSVALHECAFRIAFQEYDLSTALQHLEAIERQTDCSLIHFLKKFEILKLQGAYQQIRQQIAFLQHRLAHDDLSGHAHLRLWLAGVAHNEHNFAHSLGVSEQLIYELLARPKLAANKPVASGRKAWTRQRQHQVMKDIERLTLMHQLPLFLVAGSALALVREGDFFISDKDIDLGVFDADFERATKLLINSPYFDDVSPPNYFIGYTQLRHRATGFMVDITRYQSHGQHIHAIWQHVSGEVLRETVFAKFALREAFFPSLRCRLLIPDPVEEYLTSMYGDWRTPNPYFDTVVAACNLRCLSPFLLSLSFIKIADALLNRQHQKVQASVKHLRDAGFQSHLLTQIDDFL